MVQAPAQQPWTPADLRAWRTRLGFTQAEAAAALGVSLRAFTGRERGAHPITTETTLACMMIEQLSGSPRR